MLDELDGIRGIHRAHQSEGQARSSVVAVVRFISIPLGFVGGGIGKLFWSGGIALAGVLGRSRCHVRRIRAEPQAAQIGLSIRHARCGAHRRLGPATAAFALRLGFTLAFALGWRRLLRKS